MMAYAPGAMGLGDWFRRLFSSPEESAEESAALREDYGVPGPGEADFEKEQHLTEGAVMPGIETWGHVEPSEHEKLD